MQVLIIINYYLFFPLFSLSFSPFLSFSGSISSLSFSLYLSLCFIWWYKNLYTDLRSLIKDNVTSSSILVLYGRFWFRIFWYVCRINQKINFGRLIYILPLWLWYRFNLSYYFQSNSHWVFQGFNFSDACTFIVVREEL